MMDRHAVVQHAVGTGRGMVVAAVGVAVGDGGGHQHRQGGDAHDTCHRHYLTWVRNMLTRTWGGRPTHRPPMLAEVAPPPSLGTIVRTRRDNPRTPNVLMRCGTVRSDTGTGRMMDTWWLRRAVDPLATAVSGRLSRRRRWVCRERATHSATPPLLLRFACFAFRFFASSLLRSSPTVGVVSSAPQFMANLNTEMRNESSRFDV